MRTVATTTTKKKGAKKQAPVKWAIGGTEPDDLPDFVSNDDIVGKAGLPPKGRHRFLVKKVTTKENKNGDQMLTVTCELADKGKKKDTPWNGYTCWERLNVTEQGAPYLKRFLTALGVKWGDFVKNTVADETTDPTTITKIGKVNFASSKGVEVWASVKHGTDNNDDDVAEIGRFVPAPEDADESDDDDDDDEDEELEVSDDDDDEDADEEDEEDDEDDAEDSDDEDEEDDDAEAEEDDEDSEEELREELKALGLPKLRKRALASGADEDDLDGKKKPGLIDLIVGLELESDEDDEEEEDEDEEADTEELEAELREELQALSIGELRTRAQKNKIKKAAVAGKKKPAIIDLIVQAEIPPF